MAKQIKKASLLSEAEKQKLLKKAGNKKPITQSSAAAPAAAAADRAISRYATRPKVEEVPSAANKAKVWFGLAVLLLTAFVIAPKPQLLEYQSAGLITQSIYMPGWFGKPGVILDTNQRAVLAEEEQSLYLCFEGQSKEQCAKYQLRQQQGFIAAGLFWYKTSP